MRLLARLLSGIALAGTIVPPLLFFADRMPLPRVKFWMTVWTVVWFLATPVWMDRKSED